MLETVDLKAKLGKAEYKEALEALDLRLAELQRALRDAGIPAMIVFEGWDAAGKGSVLGRLLQPLDPRGFMVHATTPPTEQERMFPAMRRFWLRTPSTGAIAIYDQSWYGQVLDERVDEKLDEHACQAAYERIRVFERQAVDNGAVIVKFFLHISKKEQAKRFKKISAEKAYAWKVGKSERRRHKRYGEYSDAIEDMLRETSTPGAPWTLVPATDKRFAGVKVAETLVAAFEQALAAAAPAKPKRKRRAAKRRTSPLDRVDLDSTLSIEDYKKVLPKLQAEVRRLQHLCYVKRRPVILAYEGWDAAGKGGNIRRLAREMDPRGYEVRTVAAPEGEEKHHHYLWRFWRALPKAGHWTIFDRTWYGRVLVERLEGFATEEEWGRAYREINEFESDLVEYGAVVFKFWVHISKEEQLARFKLREKTPHKKWKITEEDWRNREKWDDYWRAVSDMIEGTSTARAPWTIIEGNDKRFARVRVLKTVVQRLKKALKE
jgi:AMP-polyphosphate phosphotransferase